MPWDISTWNRKLCKLSATRSPRGCKPSLRYETLNHGSRLEHGFPRFHFHPHRRVVARLIPRARSAIDAGRLESLAASTWAEQRMIDADAGIALEASSASNARRCRCARPGGDGGARPSSPARPARGTVLARFGRKQRRSLQPAFRLVHVLVGRNDVDSRRSTAPRHLAVDRVAWRVLRQRVQPPELVIELRPRFRVAVGSVHIADQDAAHRRLDVTALLEVRIARQRAASLDRLTDPRQQSWRTPFTTSALPMPDRRITRAPSIASLIGKASSV